MEHRTRISSGKVDQVQRSTNPEHQNHSENSQQGLQSMRDRSTRFLRAIADNVPSTSNTDHPMQVSELDQPRDQNHPQPNRPREVWHDRLHRYIVTRPYHLLMRCLSSPCPYEYDMDGNLRWGWYLNANSNAREVMSGDVGVREAMSPELGRVAQRLGIRVKKEEWANFAVDLLDRCDEMLEKHYLYIADIISYSDTKQVSQEEREKGEYKSMENLVRNEWEKWNAATLLDINPSEVRLDTWTEFCHDLLDKHAKKHGADSENWRYLEDILRGQTADLAHKKDDQVSFAERMSRKYKKLERLVTKKWDKWNEQNKKEWYEWNKKINTLNGRDILKAQLERWKNFFDVLDKDEVVKQYSNDGESLRYLENIKQRQISDLQCNYVFPEERGGSAYKNLEYLARAEWKAWTKEKAGALLGKDLSEVQPERWEEFTNEVLSAYEDKYKNERGLLEDKHENELILIKDILQGGATFVKDEDKKSVLYADLVLRIRHELDNRVEKQNKSDK